MGTVLRIIKGFLGKYLFTEVELTQAKGVEDYSRWREQYIEANTLRKKSKADRMNYYCGQERKPRRRHM